VFWDGIHPTTAVHHILGEAMLAAVPEPESYALLLVGLATLVLFRRQRRILKRLKKSSSHSGSGP
jgi:phospholipase/lecithinase/hemolysin